MVLAQCVRNLLRHPFKNDSDWDIAHQPENWRTVHGEPDAFLPWRIPWPVIFPVDLCPAVEPLGGIRAVLCDNLHFGRYLLRV